MNLQQLARPELLGRTGYQAALGRFDLVRLHANEFPQLNLDEDEGLNRYPPPRPQALTARLAEVLNVNTEQLLITRGSNEGIDLLVRAFCRSGIDQIITCPPTFGMYGICAEVQGAKERQVPLDGNFSLDIDAIVDAVHQQRDNQQPVKLVFLCSPANPTGNSLSWDRVSALCTALAKSALIVLDQAYIEFTTEADLNQRLARHENLVVLRTFSKAYGLAGLRCGIVVAHAHIIALLDSILAPYSVPTPTIDGVLEALTESALQDLNTKLTVIAAEKIRVSNALKECSLVNKIYPSDSNFILVEFNQAAQIHTHLLQAGILVRDFSSSPRLTSCLRITIGSPTENTQLLSLVKELCA